MAEETGPADGVETTADAETPAQSETETLAAAQPMGDEGAADDWSPPQRDEQGVAIDGHGLPINLRLRASALAEKGLEEDPAGAVSAEQLALEVERLEAYDKAYPRVAANMKVAELERIAKSEGVELGDAKRNEDRVAAIMAARPSRV